MQLAYPACHHRQVISMLLYTLLAVVVIGALFVIVALLLPSGSAIAESTRDELPPQVLPERALNSADVTATRLPVTLRGYRFAETDLLLDRLAEELRQRDATIASLRSQLGHDGEADIEPDRATDTSATDTSVLHVSAESDRAENGSGAADVLPTEQ